MHESDPALVILLDNDDEAAQVVRRAAEALEHACVTCTTVDACLSVCAEPHIGCLVLSLDVNGAAAILESPAFRSSVLTPVAIARSADGPVVARAMKLGAVEFLRKPLDPICVERAVVQAVRLSLRHALNAADQRAAASKLARLTPAEREVFDAIVKGRTMNRIAVELGRSARTIYMHSRRIMEKTGADSVAALIELAQKAREPGEGVA